MEERQHISNHFCSILLGTNYKPKIITTNLSQDSTEDMKSHNPKITNSRDDIYPTIERSMCHKMQASGQAFSNKKNKRYKQPEQQEVVTEGEA
jgi:hypothetical protein